MGGGMGNGGGGKESRYGNSHRSDRRNARRSIPIPKCTPIIEVPSHFHGNVSPRSLAAERKKHGTSKAPKSNQWPLRPLKLELYYFEDFHNEDADI